MNVFDDQTVVAVLLMTSVAILWWRQVIRVIAGATLVLLVLGLVTVFAVVQHSL